MSRKKGDEGEREGPWKKLSPTGPGPGKAHRHVEKKGRGCKKHDMWKTAGSRKKGKKKPGEAETRKEVPTRKFPEKKKSKKKNGRGKGTSFAGAGAGPVGEKKRWVNQDKLVENVGKMQNNGRGTLQGIPRGSGVNHPIK